MRSQEGPLFADMSDATARTRTDLVLGQREMGG
jgi:hypothetical protein